MSPSQGITGNWQLARVLRGDEDVTGKAVMFAAGRDVTDVTFSVTDIPVMRDSPARVVIRRTTRPMK